MLTLALSQFHRVSKNLKRTKRKNQRHPLPSKGDEMNYKYSL